MRTRQPFHVTNPISDNIRLYPFSPAWPVHVALHARGYVMSATDSASTWSTFLSDLSVSEQYTVIHSEDEFHRAFAQLCTDIRDRDPQRLLARFLRHHDQIIAFIGALDESTGLNASECLSSVFWSKAFETVLVRNFGVDL